MRYRVEFQPQCNAIVFRFSNNDGTTPGDLPWVQQIVFSGATEASVRAFAEKVAIQLEETQNELRSALTMNKSMEQNAHKLEVIFDKEYEIKYINNEFVHSIVKDLQQE